MKFKFHKYGNFGVDYSIPAMGTNSAVFWSVKTDKTNGGNSYVLVENPEGTWVVEGVRCDIVSINGIGEVRWNVMRYEKPGLTSDGQALVHFNAVLA